MPISFDQCSDIVGKRVIFNKENEKFLRSKIPEVISKTILLRGIKIGKSYKVVGTKIHIEQKSDKDSFPVVEIILIVEGEKRLFDGVMFDLIEEKNK